MLAEVRNNELQLILDDKSAAMVLFYHPNQIESSLLEVSMNKIVPKYRPYFVCAKYDCSFQYESVAPIPCIFLIVNGKTISRYNYPVNLSELEKQLTIIVQNFNDESFGNKETYHQKLQRKLKDNKWIAWTLIFVGIVTFLLDILIRINESDKKKS